MVDFEIKVEGLQEIVNQMHAFPRTLNQEIQQTMAQSLDVLQEKVPDYPPKPANSTYDRTFLLWNSLTVSDHQLHIAKTEKLGNMHQASFGSKVEYAPYVISDEMQAEVHQGWWWTMSVIVERAKDKITQLFELLAERLAQFLEGKGS